MVKGVDFSCPPGGPNLHTAKDFALGPSLSTIVLGKALSAPHSTLGGLGKDLIRLRYDAEGVTSDSSRILQTPIVKSFTLFTLTNFQIQVTNASPVDSAAYHVFYTLPLPSQAIAMEDPRNSSLTPQTPPLPYTSIFIAHL